MSKKPNFVFFFTDQQRAESVSCYGNKYVNMPNYDKLSSQGVQFENCFTQSALCSPSRCTLATGLYPHVRGNRTLWNLIKKDEPNVFKYLKDNGYNVQMYGKNDIFTQDAAEQSTTHFLKCDAPNHGENAYSYGDKEYYSFLCKPFDGSIDETMDGLTTAKGVEFIKSRKKDDEPFMLFLPLSLPHPPYGPPEPYYSKFGIDDVPELRDINDGDDVPSFRRLMRKYRGLDKLPDEFFKKIQALYLGMNECSDYFLGKILDALENSEVADNTVFILSSDHGDFAGDYGVVEKIHNDFCDIMTRVPLIIKAPNAKQGIKIKGQVGLIDLTATILDLAGIPLEHTQFGDSLVPEINGEKDNLGKLIFSENGFNVEEEHCFEGSKFDPCSNEKSIYYPQGKQMQEHPKSMCRTVMLRSLTHKLVMRPDDVSELYDLEKDPLEKVNLYNDKQYADVKMDLKEKLLTWYIKTSDTVPFKRDARDLAKDKRNIKGEYNEKV